MINEWHEDDRRVDDCLALSHRYVNRLGVKIVLHDVVFWCAYFSLPIITFELDLPHDPVVLQKGEVVADSMSYLELIYGDYTAAQMHILEPALESAFFSPDFNYKFVLCFKTEIKALLTEKRCLP